MANEKEPQKVSPFPVGEKQSEEYAKYFIGQSYVAHLAKNKALNCPVSNVTFEPSCRNNWHKHSGGQILLAVGGKGFYQEKGKAAQTLLPGDVVEIAPDVVHWHGATADSWFAHLAILTNPQSNQTTWLEAVSDDEYRQVNNLQSK